MSKSAVSDRFVVGTARKLSELMRRKLRGLKLLAVMIDGVRFADHVVLAAIAIDLAGKKHVLGLREGATENTAACKPLLADLIERGLADRALLPETVLAAMLEGEGDNDAVRSFWMRVKTNLQAGRIRMVFVADEIPAELARVVEFLNTQMDPAEVLAIEVKQFANDSLRTLVPRLVGQTALASVKKATPQVQWDEASFFRDPQKRRAAVAQSP